MKDYYKIVTTIKLNVSVLCQNIKDFFPNVYSTILAHILFCRSQWFVSTTDAFNYTRNFRQSRWSGRNIMKQVPAGKKIQLFWPN